MPFNKKTNDWKHKTSYLWLHTLVGYHLKLINVFHSKDITGVKTSPTTLGRFLLQINIWSLLRKHYLAYVFLFMKNNIKNGSYDQTQFNQMFPNYALGRL